MSKKTKKTMSNQAYLHLPLTSNQKNQTKNIDTYNINTQHFTPPLLLKYSSPTYLNKYKKNKKFVSLQNL